MRRGNPRVVSLLPAGTEIVVALGGEGALVGISHECDYPPRITARPRVTSTRIDPTASGAEIDRAVRDLLERGVPVFSVDGRALAALRPDLVLTQDLCEVCAASEGRVLPLAQALDPAPLLLPLRARDLDGIYDDIRSVGRALDLADDAEELIVGLRHRLARLPTGPLEARPRVVVLEWLQPAFLAGHWVPELVAAAGGRDVGAAPGAPSAERSWAAIAALEPEVVIVACCGFSAERSREAWHRVAGVSRVAARLGRARWALDGNAYTSRPGPRVADGAERIHAALRDRPLNGIIRLD